MRMKYLIFTTLVFLYTIPVHAEFGSILIPAEYGTVDESQILYDEGLINLAEMELLSDLDNYKTTLNSDRSIILQALIDKKQGNNKIAQANLANFIKQRTNSPLRGYAALLKGYISLQAKDYKNSEINFASAFLVNSEEFKKRNDTNYRTMMHAARYWQGISMVQQGKYQDAVPVFDNCSQVYPGGQYSDDAIFALGQSAEINRKYENAIEHFSTISRNYKKSNSFIASLIREANNRLSLRDPNHALVLLKEAEIAYRHIADKDSTGLLYEKQTYISHPFEDIQYLKGEAYNLSANFKLAISNFEVFLNTFYESPLKNYVRLGLGWAHMNQGQYGQALNYYDEIIYDLKDDDLSRIRDISKLYRTIALSRTGEKNTARNELSALSVQPNYLYLGLVLLELGQIYYEEGDYEQARRTLERANREALDAMAMVRINLLLGASYMEIGRWSKAETQYYNAEQIALKSSKILMPQRDWYIAEARLKRGIALVKNHRSGEAIPVLLSYIGEKGHKSKEDEAMFWLAEAYFRSEMLKNAALTYANLLKKYPASPRKEESLYGLGWSRFRLQEFSKSSKAFDQLIKDFPETKFKIEVLARQGDGYFYVRSYSRAAAAYEQAKRMAPNTNEGQYAAYQLGFVYYRKGAYEKSISSLIDFVRVYPSSQFAPYSLYLIGWIRFQQGKYNEAIADFNYLIQAYPQSELVAKAYYSIADSYYNMENYEKAIEFYKIIIDSYPSNPLAPEALKNIQQAYELLDMTEQAIAIAENYIAINPDSPFAEEFKFKKGNMFYSGRKYTDAIKEFDEFVRKYPSGEKTAEALYWMEKSYISMNENDKAAEVFNSLKRKFPDSEYVPAGMLELALMRKSIGEIDRADSIFTILQREYPKDQNAAQAGFERAVIKYSIGDTVAAMNIYRTIADTYPNLDHGLQSRWKIAMYLRSKRMNDSARMEFEILADNKYNLEIAAEAQYRIGELHFREEEYDKAIFAFRKYCDNFQEFTEWYSLSLMNLGECYEKIEDYNTAIETYQSLEALDPESDFGKTANRRIKRLKKKL